MIDKIIVCYTAFFFIDFVIYLLYQFDKIKIKTKSMIQWIRVTDILETILLVITHVFSFTAYGTYGLAVFYILNIILLFLQFVFAEWGFGRKILDVFWIAFYVLLFSLDVCKLSMVDIVSFFTGSESLKVINYIFNETFIGNLILGVLTPVLRTLVLEAIHRNE